MSVSDLLEKGPEFRFKSGTEAQEAGRRGGIASGESKRKKKNLRELAKAMLEADVMDEQMKQRLQALGLEDTNGGAMLMAMFDKALSGSERAAEFVRDTSGQAPKQQQQITVGDGLSRDDIRNLSDEELAEILDQDDGNSENEL